MTGATTALRQDLANKELRNTNYTQAVTLYVALFITATDDAGGGTEVANSNAYARTAVTFGAPDSSGVCSNSGIVTFPTPTGSWGTVVDAALMTSSTYGGGVMREHGPLDTPFTVSGSSTIVKFQIGTIVVQYGA